MVLALASEKLPWVLVDGDAFEIEVRQVGVERAVLAHLPSRVVILAAVRRASDSIAIGRRVIGSRVIVSRVSVVLAHLHVLVPVGGEVGYHGRLSTWIGL